VLALRRALPIFPVTAAAEEEEEEEAEEEGRRARMTP
jgi:hypothetical protein